VRRARDDEEIGRGDDGETDERRERERARRATRTATANAAATARGRARRTTKTRAGGAPVGTEKPVPIVIIDNKSDAFATVVEVSFGNYLGELLDTVAALKNLGLDINKGDVQMSGDSTKTSKFYVIDRENGEKVTKSERLEEIRQTILTNMMAFHPEAAEYIQAKAPTRAGGEGVLGKVKKKVQTGIKCAPERYHSKLEIETTDRPGLLVDVVRTLKDLSLCVVSAEVDTIGDKASDIIYVTHKGGPLSPPMEQLVVNSLSYYLSLTEEESY
jgi:UTP:GlnB (protein PII) uridylyltransferase